MGEILSDPSNLPPQESEPELEQLADWIIRHEAVPSEPEHKFRATPPEELTEIRFERRHEVKEASEDVPQAKLLPMTPISQVLQTRSLLPEQPSAQQQASAISRLRGLFKTSSSASSSIYATAILKGFGTGVVIVLVIVVILAARLLVRRI